jgi:hypothetical protein
VESSLSCESFIETLKIENCVDLLEMIDIEQNNSEGAIAADPTRAFARQHNLTGRRDWKFR